MTTAPDLLLDGPWQHHNVTARGTRFHIAEQGDGPLVLFLHGFPLFWWSWRHQLNSFAEAGYRAVAMDLRGYGTSDHTPRGYDLPSLAEDVSSLIAALGEADATIVAHDWGGFVGWTLAATHAESRPSTSDRGGSASATTSGFLDPSSKADQSQCPRPFDAGSMDS